MTTKLFDHHALHTSVNPDSMRYGHNHDLRSDNAIDSLRGYDPDKSEQSDWQGQHNYNNRLRDSLRVIEAHGVPVAVDPWNRVINPLAVSPEVLAVLLENESYDLMEREGGRVWLDDSDRDDSDIEADDYAAYDDWASDLDYLDMADKDYLKLVTRVSRLAHWSVPAEYDESGKRSNSRFDAEKYAAHVDLCKRKRAVHGLEEFTVKGQPLKLKKVQRRTREQIAEDYAAKRAAKKS